MENELKQVIQFALFNTKAPSRFTAEDELIRELEQQTMLSVLGTNMEQLPFSNKIQKYCIKRIMGSYAFTQKLLYEQSLLIDLMQSNGIPMAILKGSAAAVNYPNSAFRTSGDVDFIVYETMFLSAYKVMLNNGYKLSHSEENVDYHYTLEKNNISFELHRFPAGLPQGDRGAYIKELLTAGLGDIQMIEIEGYQVPVLPTVVNGIVLLLHIRKHLVGGLGLRQISDWMMFVDKHIDDEKWEKEYKEVLSKCGLDVLAKTVTMMCQMYLGLRDDLFWCKDASEILCSELWNYVLEKGNFGHKEGFESKGKRIAEKKELNPVVLMRKLQRDGLQKWEFFQKYKALRPFAWVRQLLFYVFYVVQHRKHIVEDVKIGKARARMIDRLL